MSSSVSHPVSVGIASFGMSGTVFHGPLLLSNPYFRLTAIGVRESKADLGSYSNCYQVHTFEELLSVPEIELVIVNTPHHTHFELALQALEAGKHVVVEKPFTVTVAEAEALLAKAQEKGVLLSTFQNRRYDGDFMTLRQVAQSGMLGRLVDFEAHYDRYRPVVDQVTWKEGNLPGSGILYNLGPHVIDQALQLFGMPHSVSAYIGQTRSQARSDDYYDIRLTYSSGVRAILRSSYLVAHEGPRYVLHGDQGSFVKYGLDPQEQAMKEGIRPGSPGWGEEQPDKWGYLTTYQHGLSIQGRIRTLPGNYPAFYDQMYKAIRLGEPLPVTAEEGLNVVRVIEAAFRSHHEQRAILL